MKYNIASLYCLAFHPQYPAFYENENILSIGQNYPLTEHYQSADEELEPNIIKISNQ